MNVKLTIELDRVDWSDIVIALGDAAMASEKRDHHATAYAYRQTRDIIREALKSVETKDQAA